MREVPCVWLQRLGVVMVLTMGCGPRPPALPDIQVDSQLRAVDVMAGMRTTKMFVAEPFIAGVDLARLQGVDAERRAAFTRTLTTLGWAVQPQPVDPWSGPRAPSLALFGPDGRGTSASQRDALKTIRDRFGEDFGPAMFDRLRHVLFALQPRLIVGFERPLDPAAAEAILRKSGAINVQPFHGLDERWHGLWAFYPNDTGLSLLTTARRLASQPGVRYVEHGMTVMEGRSER